MTDAHFCGFALGCSVAAVRVGAGVKVGPARFQVLVDLVRAGFHSLFHRDPEGWDPEWTDGVAEVLHAVAELGVTGMTSVGKSGKS